MLIDVRIPYSTKRDLGDAYNQAIESSTSDWVLLLDHDVFLACNPKWYEICVQTIQTHNPGMATCWTNKSGSALSWITYQDSPDSADIKEHIATAKAVCEQYGNSVTEVEKATGFFMLINKDIWNKVGGFPTGSIQETDWKYCDKLRLANHTILRMDGLYVYHHKARSWLTTEI